MNAVAAAAAVDDLYRSAVLEPDTIDDALLEEWLVAAAELVGPDRESQRALRAAVRLARKLARRHGDGGPPGDWRHGVDGALGSAGWQPQLDLVRRGLALAPDAATFDEMKVRHRAVHFTEWMEGVSFEEFDAR